MCDHAMTYKEAEAYLAGIAAIGMVPGLDSVRELCRRLGDPQEELAFVHLAGTNGKGSVLAFVSTILAKAGYRTGRYISPTLFEYRERIQVNGHIISKADFGRYLAAVKAAADEMVAAGQPQPTAFEIDTAMAFLYFRDQKCALVVLETGMGGTLDATNIITRTLVAVLTPIALDHQAYLGATAELIAENKAGIIKAGCTVVSAPQPEAVMAVISARCRQCGCPLHRAQPERVTGVKCVKPGRLPRNNAGGMNVCGQKFTYGAYRELAIALAGKYQLENAVVAVEVMAVLAKKGFAVTEKQLRQGLIGTVWPGRFQILSNRPLFIVDGAHNGAAAEKFAASLKFYFTNKRIIYIMGILKDKDYREIIRPTGEYAEHIITVTTPGPRGRSGYELGQILRQYHPRVTAADSLEEAAELAGLLAGQDGVIAAFGSLSYLGALIKIVTGREKR